MVITEDEIMTLESDKEDIAVLKETWPIPPEDYTREFEDYLMEIGLRF